MCLVVAVPHANSYCCKAHPLPIVLTFLLPAVDSQPTFSFWFFSFDSLALLPAAAEMNCTVPLPLSTHFMLFWVFTCAMSRNFLTNQRLYLVTKSVYFGRFWQNSMSAISFGMSAFWQCYFWACHCFGQVNRRVVSTNGMLFFLSVTLLSGNICSIVPTQKGVLLLAFSVL